MSYPNPVGNMTINKENTCNAVDKILITCPHNGLNRPDKIEEREESKLPSGCKRSQFNKVNDLYTRTLSKEIAYRMYELCGKFPGLVIAEYDRKYIDMNRFRKCAYEVQQAQAFYDEYHQHISQHIEAICNRNKDSYIKGWLFDIHGKQDADVPEDIAIGTEDGKTIARLKKINPDALWDDTGLIKLLQQKYTTNPKNKSESESSKYNGGYTINEYDCSFDKGGLQRIQLEIELRLREKKSERKKFVEHLVNIILLLVSRYSNNT